MVAMRSACHETRWVLREVRGERLRDHVGKLVCRDMVPYAEDETATPLQDPVRLAIALNFVGKKHHPKLTRHNVEALGLKGKVQGIGLSPLDRVIPGLPPSGMLEHWLV